MTLTELTGQLRNRLEEDSINIITCVPVDEKLRKIRREAQWDLLNYIDDLVVRGKVEELE